MLHRITLIEGPTHRARDEQMTPTQDAYARGWNDCLAAVEQANGVGDMWRCTCGVDYRDPADADAHAVSRNLFDERKR